MDIYRELYEKLYNDKAKETALTRSRHNYYLRKKDKIKILNKDIYLRAKHTSAYKRKQKEWNINYLDKRMLNVIINRS